MGTDRRDHGIDYAQLCYIGQAGPVERTARAMIRRYQHQDARQPVGLRSRQRRGKGRQSLDGGNRCRLCHAGYVRHR